MHNDVVPFVSSEDIEKGAVWFDSLRTQLDTSGFLVICVTAENIGEPWVVFEAAYVYKLLGERIAPLLVDLEKREVRGPFAHFQLTSLDKEDVRKLVRTVNRACDKKIDEAHLDVLFEARWPVLETDVKAARAPTARSVVIELVGQKDPRPPAPLSDKHHLILKVIAETPGAEPTAGMLGHAIGESEARAHYYLDGLKDLAYVVEKQVVDEPSSWELSRRGRAYAAETGLI